MYLTRLPSRNSWVRKPGRRTSSRSVDATRPSQPENSATASPANSRKLGYGGTSRWPQAEQNARAIGASQLRQRAECAEARRGLSSSLASSPMALDRQLFDRAAHTA